MRDSEFAFFSRPPVISTFLQATRLCRKEERCADAFEWREKRKKRKNSHFFFPLRSILVLLVRQGESERKRAFAAFFTSQSFMWNQRERESKHRREEREVKMWLNYQRTPCAATLSSSNFSGQLLLNRTGRREVYSSRLDSFYGQFFSLPFDQ